MDIKEAIRLLEMGRLEDLDLDVLWELEEVLSTGIDTHGYYLQFKNIVGGKNTNFPAFVQAPLPQRSLALRPQIEANIKAVKAVEKEINFFAADNAGHLQNPEAEQIFNFYKQVKIQNKAAADKVEPADFFQNLTAMAVLDAHEKIYLNPKFAAYSKEEQLKTYQNAVLMSLQETAFILVSNQQIENRGQKENADMKPAEVESLLHRVMAGREDENVAVSNQNIIGTLSAGMNRLRNSTRRLNAMTGIKELNKEIEAIDLKFVSSYPDNYPAMKPLTRGQDIAFIAGPVGQSSYGAWKIGNNLREETVAARENSMTLFTHLRQKPNTLKFLGRKIAGTIARVITTLRCAAEAGMINETVARNWKAFVKLQNGTANGASKKDRARFNMMLASVNAKAAYAEEKGQGNKGIQLSLFKKIVDSRIGRFFTARGKTVSKACPVKVSASRGE